jgi:transcriptional regulator with XRE-family HTH domain
VEQKVVVSPSFGGALKRWRLNSGLSLRQFAEKVNYTPGHLSKVENGRKAPSRFLVVRADELLHADGELIGMILATESITGTPRPSAAVLDVLSGPLPQLDESGSLDPWWNLLVSLRVVGQAGPPTPLVAAATHQARVLGGVAAQSSQRQAREAYVVGARFFEYAGWMAQEAGDPVTALALTAKANEWAQLAGDTAFEAYALVRKAVVALYDHDYPLTTLLAQQAQAMTSDDRVRGLAALQEAHGHAGLGRVNEFTSALARGADFLSRGETGDKAPGSAHVVDQVGMAEAWCQSEVGRYERAADLLRNGIAQTSPFALRTTARYEARYALVLERLGDLDGSCAAAATAMGKVTVVESETVRQDLRALRRRYAYYSSKQGNTSVRTVLPDLTSACRPSR